MISVYFLDYTKSIIRSRLIEIFKHKLLKWDISRMVWRDIRSNCNFQKQKNLTRNKCLTHFKWMIDRTHVQKSRIFNDTFTNKSFSICKKKIITVKYFYNETRLSLEFNLFIDSQTQWKRVVIKDLKLPFLSWN